MRSNPLIVERQIKVSVIGANCAARLILLLNHLARSLTGLGDKMQLPIYDAIKELPRLKGHPRIRAQISGAEGANRVTACRQW